MKTKVIIVILVLSGVFPAQAGLVFNSGHNIYDESSGSNSEVSVINDAILDVLGGTITGYLMSTDISTVNINNGNIDQLWTRSNSIANIHGGIIDFVKYEGSSLIYLYAYDVTYHTTGGGEWGNSPWIEGIYLQNNSHFDFLVPGSETQTFSYIRIVPEPATLLLLGLGCLFLRQKK
jgi:hypothetical protein